MQIAEHVHTLRIPFEIRPAPNTVVKRFVYAYLIVGERSVCLVDTGVAGSQEAILQAVASLGRSPKDVAVTILTHSHPDHIGSLKTLAETSGCTVVAHKAEKPWIEKGVTVVDREKELKRSTAAARPAAGSGEPRQ